METMRKKAEERIEKVQRYNLGRNEQKIGRVGEFEEGDFVVIKNVHRYYSRAK